VTVTDPEPQPVPPAIAAEPATAEQLRALIDGPDRFREAFGLTVVDGYLEFPDALPFSLRWLEEDGVAPEWASYLFIHIEDRAVIGMGGYKGPPADGIVEIGYGIAPAYRRAGYAAAAARALIERAHAVGVTTVIAHTLAEPNPSTRVLGKLGFVQTDTIEDPEDGPIWRWELGLTPPC